jgi:NAD(P)-dependent dehydrogenase (short-subunit alcohol dehydrogenase family)
VRAISDDAEETRTLLAEYCFAIDNREPDAVLWLVSDQAKFVSGVTLPIDGGATCP